jgi:UDP-sulfoquinovose synthase
MTIAILGADGYYGTALTKHFRDAGFENLLLIDNLTHRRLDSSPSLTPLQDFVGHELDVAAPDQLHPLLRQHGVTCIVHLAEQRSAPYSQLSFDTKAYTLRNNLGTTLSVLEFMRENPDVRLVHIGSMGVYGYNKSGLVSEGDIVRQPGSVYHASKCCDSTLFEMYSRLYGLDITDLHQGIMWGLGGRFDYDGCYGTVLNRFMLQDLAGKPVTVYGDGNKERAFINIADSVRCVEHAVTAETFRPGYKQYNQFTEIKSVTQIAALFQRHNILENPRIEKANVLEAENSYLRNKGLLEVLITPQAIAEIQSKLKPHLNRLQEKLLFDTGPKW